jgi:uncharacterized damage-inducible protein DinB
MSQFSNPAGRAPTAAAAYVRALTGLVGDRDPIEVLVELPGWLEARTLPLSDAARRRPEAPGKWSVHDAVQHLADAETAFLWRTRLICAEEGEPVLQGYDQDRWAAQLRYQDAPFEEVLEEVIVMRRRNLRLVRTLTPAELERAGRHVERGRESLALMLPLMAGHDLVHRKQLERIIATVGN